jgi:hypothetical protein
MSVVPGITPATGLLTKLVKGPAAIAVAWGVPGLLELLVPLLQAINAMLIRTTDNKIAVILFFFIKLLL